MSKRKRKEEPDIKATCLKEIEELNKEISCLENDLETKESHSAELFSDECLAGVIDHLQERLATKTRNSRQKPVEEQDINSLLRRLEKLESLTGIIFVKNQAELISSNDDNNNARNAKKWRRILSGKCFSLSFLIELETEEMIEEEESTNVEKEMGDQENIAVRVTNLSIKVNCTLAAKELNSFIANSEQVKAIGTTFLALKQYAKWYDCRGKTFAHFKTKYPDLICILNGPDESDTIEIRNHNHNGLGFIIQWTIDTSKDGHVLPQIDAFVACPSKMCDSEKGHVLNSTPEQFRKMLSSFGIEQAIECIIRVVQQ